MWAVEHVEHSSRTLIDSDDGSCCGSRLNGDFRPWGVDGGRGRWMGEGGGGRGRVRKGNVKKGGK